MIIMKCLINKLKLILILIVVLNGINNGNDNHAKDSQSYIDLFMSLS